MKMTPETRARLGLGILPQSRNRRRPQPMHPALACALGFVGGLLVAIGIITH